MCAKRGFLHLRGLATWGEFCSGIVCYISGGGAVVLETVARSAGGLDLLLEESVYFILGKWGGFLFTLCV
jgi:hypothetical protein